MAGGRKKKKSGVGLRSCFGWRWILGLGFPFFLYFSFKIAPLLMGVEGNYL
jgi:hypothetical protein